VTAPSADDATGTTPASWRGPGREAYAPVWISIALAAVLQLVTPSVMDAWVDKVLCSLLVLALVILVVASREDGRIVARHIRGHSTPARRFSQLVIVLLSFANLGTGLVLTVEILGDSSDFDALDLLINTGAVWITNVIVFALWYWEYDRGGPGRRAEGTGRVSPAFIFPQMLDPEVAEPNWRPFFFDYLYLSFTNAASFASADALPAARWAKATMLCQSALSLSLLLLVLSRVAGLLR
jgi:uncharacterized membrane protein